MRTKILAAIAVLAMAGSVHAAEFVTNGDFTLNTLTGPQMTSLLGAGRVGVEDDSHFIWSNAVTGWNSVNTGQDYNLYFFDGNTAKLGDADSRYPGEQQRPNANFTPLSPTSGGFMVLDGDPSFNGAFEQDITGLTVGAKYHLTFWYASGELSNRTGYTSEQLTGSFGGDAFSTATFFNSQPVGVPGDFSGWAKASFYFTAGATNQVLSFLAVGTPAANLPPVSFLDKVSLTDVPEPAAWAMMLVGFGSLGGAMRRRRKIAAA
jgi:hypothetical protein